MKDSSGAQGRANTPPSAREVAQLRPTLIAGASYTFVALATFVSGILLSASDSRLYYWSGQALLGFFFFYAFILLHEAGHNTLFPQKILNRVVGHIAGFLTLIPFWNWQRVHARHHKYAGWQDLDATTASLVPRPIPAWERRIIDFVWMFWIPVFAMTYRIQNFWNLPRIGRFITHKESLHRIRMNTLAALVGYGAILVTVGVVETITLIGPAFLASLVAQEALILSQHTHVPQRVSGGRNVQPFSPLEQATYTRSLRFPAAVSVLFMHVDAHELHHMYPFVPGYLLRCIKYRPGNEVNWWLWIKTARRLRGTDFLFRNWDDTGVHI